MVFDENNIATCEISRKTYKLIETFDKPKKGGRSQIIYLETVDFPSI